MQIRRASESDIPGLNHLLEQVLTIHHLGRPDIFKPNAKKYTDAELIAILRDDMRPVFTAVDGENKMLGYAFCMFVQHKNDNILTDILTLYIDDLCVDETCRGQGIGKALYEYVLAYAREQGCYNVTLNVWAENRSAKAFYESLGLKPQKTYMEQIL